MPPQTPAAAAPDVENKSYTRRNILILLGVLAVPTVLVFVAYFSGSRSHMTLGGGSIWNSSLLADDGSSNSDATWLSVADTGSIESGALAEHLAQTVPQLGGTSGIFRRESTHATYIRLPEGGPIDIDSHEEIPITLSAETWQGILTRASDERMGSVSVSARGAGEYETEDPWVEVKYYLYGDNSSDQQSLLADMASWEPLSGPDLESVSYMDEIELDTDTVQVFAFGPLSEVQAWSSSATPIAQAFAAHTEGLEVVSINKYRDSTNYFVTARFDSYAGDTDAARQAMVEGVQGTAIGSAFDLDLMDATTSAYYFEGRWDVYESGTSE
ncbi:MAG: hypothetical protein Q4A03_05715 [Rothia sp. (in: high G+C Gram-positive bacteria)]|uniref:hypothetical protein n=1 Tax=Rothia sp. (in: high G+C Gram-positive bacteria) TaxID=1885016 RepID=UPI002704C254|nr:hypothetical protein [Rothia sp. (in: high G+C Gram-positive bacteria)]